METPDNLAEEMDEVPKHTTTRVSITKSLKQHFFDFLMLFLAITLGFFADNFRDAYSDKQKAQDLAAELKADIMSDTMILHSLIRQRENKIAKLDSLYYYLKDDAPPISDSMLYTYSAYVTDMALFERNSGTWQQMTSAGYLNLFSKEASHELSIYQILFVRNEVKEENERAVIRDKVYPFMQQIFHTEHFLPIRMGKGLQEVPPLRHWDKDTRWIYHNYVTELNEICYNLKQGLIELNKKATAVLAILKNEYGD